MRNKLVTTTEDKFLVVVLVVLLAVSLAIPVYEEITDQKVPASWNTPVVLFALYAITRLVGSLPKIKTDVSYLRQVADVRVQRMPNARDFFENLSRALDRATSTLDLTHIRDTPPSEFGKGPATFFERVIQWSGVEGRLVRRIIAVRSPAMYQWALELQEATAHLPQLKVHVIEWATDAPAMNMAIVDGEAVYLALTGQEVERMKGLGMEDETAAQYFTDYYDNLWRNSVPLGDWLAANSREGF